MRGLLRGEADELLQARLTPTVWDPKQLDGLIAVARRSGCETKRVPMHLEVDTGMLRQGAAGQCQYALRVAGGSRSKRSIWWDI